MSSCSALWVIIKSQSVTDVGVEEADMNTEMPVCCSSIDTDNQVEEIFMSLQIPVLFLVVDKEGILQSPEVL